MKTCSRCRTEKSPEEFGKDKTRGDGKNVYCKECVRITQKVTRKRCNAQRTEYNKQYREKNRKRYNEWERNYYRENQEKLNSKCKKWRDEKHGTYVVMHLGARGRAAKKKLEYAMSPIIIASLCLSQDDKCALTGIPFDYSSTTEFKNRPFAPSIDRIDSKKGYVPGNVQITCVMVNKAKNEFPQGMFDEMCIARAEALGYARA